RVQTIERVEQFVSSRVVETAGHVDVTDTGFQHVSIRNRRLWNSVTNDVDLLDPFVSRTLQRQLNCGATRATNLVAHFQRRLASHLYAIDFDNAVAVAQSGSACG